MIKALTPTKLLALSEARSQLAEALHMQQVADMRASQCGKEAIRLHRQSLEAASARNRTLAKELTARWRLLCREQKQFSKTAYIAYNRRQSLRSRFFPYLEPDYDYLKVETMCHCIDLPIYQQVRQRLAEWGFEPDPAKVFSDWEWPPKELESNA